MDALSERAPSTDLALTHGTPRWWRHATGLRGPSGTFQHWTVHAEPDLALERALGAWASAHLGGFTGVVNIETIGGTIIECHPRMANQWLDLNGAGWLAAAVRLYATAIWRFDDRRRECFSVTLFVPHGGRWQIDRNAAADLSKRPGISRIVTYDETFMPDERAMPPGRFRLAIVNSWDLDAGYAVCTELERRFAAGGP